MDFILKWTLSFKDMETLEKFIEPQGNFAVIPFYKRYGKYLDLLLKSVAISESTFNTSVVVLIN